MKYLRRLAVLALPVVVAVSLGVPAKAAPSPDGHYDGGLLAASPDGHFDGGLLAAGFDVASAPEGGHIINENSGLCLVARDTTPGTGAVQTPCAAFADQNWILVYPGLGIWRIRNAHTGLCLAVQNNVIEQQVVDRSCDIYGDLRTQWSINTSGEYTTIFSRFAGGCLVVRGKANEAPVVTTLCHPELYKDQRWYIPG